MRKKKKKQGGLFSIFRHLNEETVQGIWAVIFFVLGLFFLFAAAGIAGVVGTTTYKMLTLLLGIGYYLLPLLSFMLAISFFKSLYYDIPFFKVFGSLLFFLSGLGLIGTVFEKKGGIVGAFITQPFVALFDIYVTLFLLWGMLIISLLILFNASLPIIPLASFFGIFKRKKVEDDEYYEDEDYDEAEEDKTEETEDVDADDDEEEEEEEEEGEAKSGSSLKNILGFGTTKSTRGQASFSTLTDQQYSPPPISLLEKDKGKPGFGDIKASANIIKRTLQNFGISVEIDEISVGPTVTRFALKPAEGVRLQKIIRLQNNLELALAAHPVRIEAPIPGRSLVGIEVPNTSKATVGLATMLSADAFRTSPHPLCVALGKDITGETHFANIAKMPHLLIAGATGSGKSVTVHALITSLLYRNSPEHLRFIFIDPKRVELTLYNNIPHLLTPVITDPKKAILALKWAAREMERRYDILETESSRDIASYHKNVLGPAMDEMKKNKDASDDEDSADNLPEAMPHMVIVIDELADIMQAYPRELESAIVRLAQMSRAVGIHIILSTQRPSVNIVTGLIKANIPSRIALQVSSQIDSRTILDTGGAEKLLGAGDMLYLSSDMSKPLRMQTAYISETEVKKVVKYIIKQGNEEPYDEIDFTTPPDGSNSIFSASLDGDEDDGGDELYEEAREMTIAAGKGSTSYLQRKLRVGYARAARIMDELEEKGVIGPSDGTNKPRDVLDQSPDDEEEEYAS